MIDKEEALEKINFIAGYVLASTKEEKVWISLNEILQELINFIINYKEVK